MIFEGDLAHVAASHLKPNDRVHIAGELFADSPTHQGNVNVQVHCYRFVMSCLVISFVHFFTCRF